MSGEIDATLEPLGDAPALAADWRALAARADRGFFLGWGWIGAWLAALPADCRPWLFRARQGGLTIGLALLVPRRTRRRGIVPAQGLYLHATGDAALDGLFIEHNGILCAAGDEARLMARLVPLALNGRAGPDELYLPGLTQPVETPPGLLAQTQTETGYAVDLARVTAASGDLGRLVSRNARQQLGRALRAYERLGALDIAEAGTAAEALAFFAGLKALHIASWQRRGRRHAFAQPAFERFHTALIAREAGSGGAQLLRIAAGGAAIGYLYNFCHEGRVLAYQSGFADGDPPLRPGVVSHYLAIRLNAERGARVYDFLAGDNRLKQSFATDRYTLYWQVLRQPRLKYRLESAARRLKQRLAR